jgi:hypothetical protein
MFNVGDTVFFNKNWSNIPVECIVSNIDYSKSEYILEPIIIAARPYPGRYFYIHFDRVYATYPNQQFPIPSWPTPQLPNPQPLFSVEQTHNDTAMLKKRYEDYDFDKILSPDTTIACMHTWKQYQGFTESYKYCSKCDAKE